MVQASVSGAIDFSKADPLDSWWWKKLHLVLDELERRAGLEARKAEQIYLLTHAVQDVNSEAASDEVKDRNNDNLNRFIELLFPWTVGQRKTKDQREEIDDLLKAAYGYGMDSQEMQEQCRIATAYTKELLAKQSDRKSA